MPVNRHVNATTLHVAKHCEEGRTKSCDHSGLQEQVVLCGTVREGPREEVTVFIFYFLRRWPES